MTNAFTRTGAACSTVFIQSQCNTTASTVPVLNKESNTQHTSRPFCGQTGYEDYVTFTEQVTPAVSGCTYLATGPGPSLRLQVNLHYDSRTAWFTLTLSWSLPPVPWYWNTQYSINHLPFWQAFGYLMYDTDLLQRDHTVTLNCKVKETKKIVTQIHTLFQIPYMEHEV